MALRLVSRRTPPPNGFLYKQVQTNWESWRIAPETQWDFKALCRAIQQHRQSNPRFRLTTDLIAIANEVDAVNARRVAAIPGSDTYIMDDAAAQPIPKAQALSQTLPGKLRDAVAGLRNINAGRVMLLDWETAGYPQVPQELAEQRATVCVSCPKNGRGDFTRWFTIPAAERIHKQIERLKDVKLATSKDDQLGVCEVCLCPLRLKMHTPIEFVGKYLSAELRAELAAVQTGLGTSCWVTSEIK